MAFTLNPFTAEFDYYDNEVRVVSAAPSSGEEGVFYQVSTSPTKVYYFSGGNRYLITGTLDNPGIIPFGLVVIPQ